MGSRTVILFGVKDLATHDILAFVWGGRVECIVKTPESSIAQVKFLTAEACKRYFQDTKNGVKGVIRGKEVEIHVEGTRGPNSQNHTIEQWAKDPDTSRCIYANGVEVDLSEHTILKLAEGSNKNKRKIDIIKRQIRSGVRIALTLYAPGILY
jgi:hypothetical protein